MSSNITTALANTQSRFASCNECIKALEENCLCWEAEKGDYLQVFILALMIILMYLASYCLGFARASTIIGGVSELNPCKMSCDKAKSLKTDIVEASTKYTEHTSVSGIPFSLYLILNALLSATYFIIKLIIYFANSSHYLSNINKQFDTLQWNEFYNAHVILMATIYSHSFFMLYQNVSVSIELKEKKHGSCMNTIIFICTTIMSIDFLGSIVLMCIKYPLMITALYHGGVCILTIMGIGITLYCHIAMVACYSKILSFICSLFVCGSSIRTSCGRYIRNISNGIILLTINYIFICVVLCLCFLFVNGPNYCVIYLDLTNNSMDRLIIWLYLLAMCIGFIGFIIGAINTLYKQCCHSKHSKATDNNGYHHPRYSNTTFEVEVMH